MPLAFVAVAVLGSIVLFTSGGMKAVPTAATVQDLLSSQPTTPWSERDVKGSVVLQGQVPLAVAKGTAGYVGPHSAKDVIRLNFALPLRDRQVLDQLIALEGKTHQSVTRAELYSRFAPPQVQINALQSWLKRNGFTITHTGADRLTVGAAATTATVEKALHVKIADYIRSASTFGKVHVPRYVFYANTTAPRVPARLGIQSISGLSNVSRFFTSIQLATGSISGCSGDTDPAVINPLCVDVRSGGYYPTDLRSLYDVTGHGFDGTGQTIGFTLWTVPERQAAMNTFATTTGDQVIILDPSCTATGNSPTSPSSCSTQTVGPDHLLFILENGNLDTTNNFGSNVETALDVEAAHGIATHVGMKYYASECAATPPANSGLANAGCNGTDVGMEMAMEDAANDPTLHSVSNSWAYGGEAEWGATDPFVVATSNILALAAAAGTTFYYSTGDSGTYESGYPSDSPYVVAVGGTSTYSTSAPGTYSTTVAWSGGGSWCSNLIARPSWQTGAGVTANASCPGRVIPDVSAVADPNTGVRYTASTNLTGGTASGQVGGTSLAAPVMSGLQALTQSFIAAQTYPGATPSIGFTAPVMYQLGNSSHYSNYYRDIRCGNTANPTSGPDGDAAITGWDAATGWGEPEWFNFSIGYAMALGATNLSVPPSLSTGFGWSCAKTPSNSTERGFSFPSASTGYAVGAASGATPWYGKFLPSGAWGAVNTFFKTTDGGATWFPSNSDMFSVACTSTSTCVEVGAGGRERRTTDSGTTWSDVATAPGNNKPLTQVTCPSSSICYAVGDRGNAMKSKDGGQTWSWLSSTDGNPIYGLSCPTTSTCYAADIYAHVFKTTDGGASWTSQVTPITTPYFPVVAETGGPAPWGGLMGISCSGANTCVGVGLYATVSGQTNPNPDPPIVTTTDGGTTWTRQVSGTGTGNFLHAVSCLPGTQTCTAVGRSGKIVTTTNLTTWTAATSGTTNMLNGVTCLSTSFCMAVGQNGTVDIWNGATWTATTGNGGTGMLASVSCLDTSNCYATGKQGVTIATTNGGGSWTIQAGGGTTQPMNGVSCPSSTICYAAGNAGTILKTTNGGQTWLAAASGTTQNLNAISCGSTTTCAAVGAVSGTATVRYTTDGSAWSGGTGTGTQALNGAACTSSSACLAVGAAGTILASSDGGARWTAETSGTTGALNAITCPTGACYAVGAVVSGFAVVLKSVDGGSTWTGETSNTANPLSGVACVDSSTCFADGTFGTVVATTDGGATWTQRGNPLSGPTTALNATSIALNGAACTSARCVVGTGVQGDIMTTPLLHVSVQTSSPYGTTPNLTGLLPGNAALSYNPSTEAANVTGTITCSTTATNASNVGSYPVSGCSGLADSGYSVVYDYGSSSHTVTKANQEVVIGVVAPSSAAYGTGFAVAATGGGSGNPVTYGSSGACTNTGAEFTMTSGSGTCTVTYDQAGDANHNAAPQKTEHVTAKTANQSIDVTTDAPASAAYNAQFSVAANAPGGAVSFSSAGVCTNTGATFTMTSGTGTCTVRFDRAADNNYNAAPQVSESVTATKIDQSITFAAPAGRTYGDANFDPGATSSSGYAVSYGASGACSIVSGKVHFTGAGSCSVTASQAGDADYNAAPQVQRTFSVGKAALSITANNRQKFYDQLLTLGTMAFTRSGLVGSDSVSGVTLTSSGAAAGAASGNYAIVPSHAVAGPSTNLGNYTITYHNGTLHVSAVGIIGLSGVSVATSGGKIDSFNSSAGAYGPSNHGSAALVMSNGTLSFAGVALLGSATSTHGSVSVKHTASVSGNVTAGTTASILGTVGGTVTQHSVSTALAVPTVAACHPHSAKTGISGGKFIYSPSTGNLTVQKGTVKLANRTYCFNNVTLAAGAKLSVSGPVTIQLTGKLTGKGQIVNTTNRPANLHIDSSFTGSGGVAIVGDSQAAMTILAPRTTVTISGGSFFGTLLAKTVSLTGAIAFHADMR